MKKQKKLLQILTVLVICYDTIQLLAALMMWKGRKMEQKNRGRSHKAYLNFMNGCSRKLKDEAVEEIKVTSIMGGMELDLTGAKLAAQTHIELCSVMSGIIIKVPPLVEIREDARAVMSGIANMVPHYNQEGLPIIYLNAKCLMAGVHIKVVCDEKK